MRKSLLKMCFVSALIVLIIGCILWNLITTKII